MAMYLHNYVLHAWLAVAGLLVLWSLANLLIRLALERWPRLYENSIGGVRVFVTARDYRKARKVPGTNLRLVVPAFAFHERKRICREELSGDLEDYNRLLRGRYHYLQPKDRGDIFVPYVSQMLSREEQQKLFPPTPPEDIRTYICRWPSLVDATIAYMEFKEHSGYLPALALKATMVIALFCGASWWVAATTFRQAEKGLSAIQVARPWKANSNLPVRDFGETRLALAYVTDDPVYMGGGLVSVRVRFRGQGGMSGAVRASSLLNLKKGDPVIVRRGKILYNDPEYGYEQWVISKEEAKALLVAGFQMDD